MRRLASSLLLATTVTTAALLPGAAVFASEHQDPSCADGRRTLAEAVESSSVIVLGRLGVGVADGTAELVPERFYKGPVSGGSLRLSLSEEKGCVAPIPLPSRVVLFLHDDARWPSSADAYILRDDRAYSLLVGDVGSERAFLNEIRGLTGQSAVPAASDEEGQGIEWGSTVFPIALALGIVFVIGLFLMRIWHRIDPS